MGGGGDTERTVVNTSGGGGQGVIPELQPYVQRVGQIAYNTLGDPNLWLGNFTGGGGLQVPGLSPLEMFASQQIANRGRYGIPVPPAEQTAGAYASALPGAAGTQVPVSPWMSSGLDTARQIAQQGQKMLPFAQSGVEGLQSAMAPGPMTMSGANALTQFTSPDAFGTSPAVQNALRGIEGQVLPQVQNAAAKAGLAQSGFLPEEVGRTYANALTPLYMQGLQQSQQAGQSLLQGGLQQGALQAGAGNALLSGGTAALEQQLRSLQNLRDTYMSVGQNEQALQTEAQIRQLQATVAMVPELRQIGLQQGQRPIQSINEMMTAGNQMRQIELAQNQSLMDAYLRNREMALGFVNPFGSFAQTSNSPGQVTTNRKTSGGGWSLGK